MNRISKKFNKQELLNRYNGTPFSLEECQNHLLQMMKAFDSFCREKNLKYFLAFGTLLGAIRHNGFIPWDDDVDILMPREDFEKLISFSCINSQYSIVSLENPGQYYHPYPYCNITDENTIQIEHNARCQTGKGLFLDVFPLDTVPDDASERESFNKKILFYRYLRGLQTMPIRKIDSFKTLVMNICTIILSPFDEIKLARKIDKMAKQYRYSNYKTCAHMLLGKLKRVTWDKEDFSEVIEHKFGDGLFFVPKQYDKVLSKTYGKYMVLPKEEDRVPHHGVDVFYR